MSSSDQVKNFYGLSKLPFSKGLSVNELFQADTLVEAVNRLEIAAENEEAALLTGTSGIGKSNIIRYFVNQIDTQKYRTVYVSAGNIKIGELAKRSLAGLGFPVPFQGAQALRKFRDTVIDFHASKNLKVILIIDEAQELSVETLSGLKSLLNYQMDNANLLFLLLCGHITIADTLKMIPLESINRRIRIRYESAPLSLQETASYIYHHLKICGLKKNIFSDDAMACVYQNSRGLPSEINRLCFDAVIYAASKSKDIIEKSVIEGLHV